MPPPPHNLIASAVGFSLLEDEYHFPQKLTLLHVQYMGTYMCKESTVFCLSTALCLVLIMVCLHVTLCLSVRLYLREQMSSIQIFAFRFVTSKPNIFPFLFVRSPFLYLFQEKSYYTGSDMNTKWSVFFYLDQFWQAELIVDWKLQTLIARNPDKDSGGMRFVK